MIPILFTPEVEPEALLDVNNVPLFDVNGVQLMAKGDPTAARPFNTYGLGALTDSISCTVSEERNGEYELVLEYPANGVHFSEIEERCIIWAKPNYADNPQAFRIYQITKPINGVITVNAQHIVYDLSGVPVLPFTAQNCASACSGLISHAAFATPFEITTQIGTIADFAVDVPSSVRSWFGGKEGSLIDTYGGEWHYDNYTAFLDDARGTNRGVVIRYGKNLLDIRQEENIANMWTGVLPYWYDEQTGAIVRTSIINVEGSFDFRRILCLDLSQDFQEKPTAAALKARAETYIRANDIGKPSVNITLDWAQVGDLSDRVDLCDTVSVEFEKLGISATAKCIKTVWDVLKDRYSAIEFGDAKTNIADTIVGLQDEEEKAKSTVTPAMLRAINNATALITGNEGGYVVLRDGDGDGEPDEILVMNTPDIETATSVWRWNKNGLGFSASGYSGTYGLALTSDGAIVADRITTGTLQGIEIIGDVGTIGGWTLSENSLYREYEDSGNTYRIELNASGTLAPFRIRRNGESTAYINRGGYITSRETTSGYVAQLYNSKLIFGDANNATLAELRRYSVSSGYGVELYGANGVSINSAEQMQIKAGDGIWITTGSRQLFVQSIYNTTISSAANVFVNNLGALYRSTSSSKRYKTDITEDLGVLDPNVLYELPVVRFKFKDEYLNENDERFGKDVIGFIAEDVDELYPIAVRHENGEPEMWESNYMIPAMLKLIQDQKKKIDRLEERISKLEARVNDDDGR